MSTHTHTHTVRDIMCSDLHHGRMQVFHHKPGRGGICTFQHLHPFTFHFIYTSSNQHMSQPRQANQFQNKKHSSQMCVNGGFSSAQHHTSSPQDDEHNIYCVSSKLHQQQPQKTHAGLKAFNASALSQHTLTKQPLRQMRTRQSRGREQQEPQCDETHQV